MYKVILVEEQQWYYLTHSWRDKRVHAFDFVSLSNGMSTFVGYLMTKPFLLKNSSDTI